MRRATLVVLAAMVLTVGPVVAVADPQGWRLFHHPQDTFIGPPESGEVFITVQLFDGKTWHLADRVAIRPVHPDPQADVCGPTLGPTPPVS